MDKFKATTLILLVVLILSSCIDKPKTLPPIPQPIHWLNRPANFPLPSFSGKVTILGFYTEDCSGCAKIQPTLRQIIKKYGDKIQMIGVYTPLPHQAPTLTEIKIFLKKHNITYPILLDHETKILRTYRVTDWPTLIIADRNQHIIQRLHRSQEIINLLPKILQKATN